MGEYEFEPVPGLPQTLPEGERMLWQGSPDWRRLAIEAFHVRKLAAYFGGLVVWRAVTLAHDGHGVEAVALSAGSAALLAAAALGLLAGIAWASARSTIYTVTSRRVVMRFGVALPMTLNLPFTALQSVSLKAGADGSGDIALDIAGRDRVSYIVLWPHARPWKVARPQPSLRAVPHAARAARILGRALAAAAGGPSVTAMRATAGPERAAGRSGPLAPAA